MNKSAVETVANWTLAVPNFTPATGITITNVVYNNVPPNWNAVFTLSAPGDFSSVVSGAPFVTGNEYIGDVGGNGLLPLAIATMCAQ
jgi:hypothetical protein